MNSEGMTRSAIEPDQRALSEMMKTSTFVHYHLDWRPPMSWIGTAPFLVLEGHSGLISALACPPEPPRVAWLRLFVTDGQIPAQDAWNILWEPASLILSRRIGITAAAIVMVREMIPLLEGSGFTTLQQLVFLEKNDVEMGTAKQPEEVFVRPMLTQDLPVVEAVDASSFDPLWHNALADITRAHVRAFMASVAEIGGVIAGYQISTRNSLGVHLARLAVVPKFQGHGVGSALVQDLITRSGQRGIQRFTVNTQSDNSASLSLYSKLGFFATGERYPVYIRTIS